MDCKNALEEAEGNEEKAVKILEKKGKSDAIKKAQREAKEGLIEAYVHSTGKVGVILELNCETDFVAKNNDFKELAHDIAMHIAAMAPEDEGELLSQPFIKDEQKSIKDLIEETIAKLGENIKIKKFVRLEI